MNQTALFQFNHGCVGIQNPGTSPATLAVDQQSHDHPLVTGITIQGSPFQEAPGLLARLPGALTKPGGTEAPPSLPQQPLRQGALELETHSKNNSTKPLTSKTD